MVSDMDRRHTRSGSTRVGGNVALVTGLLIALLMVSPENPQTGGYVLAGLLVLTGVGLRVEAALTALQEQRGGR
jgi:UDP-N-acetylmuramyl pentapeptide phosphotransferase/UDP-N-acetylglucosamine-1-phosphate transferase